MCLDSNGISDRDVVQDVKQVAVYGSVVLDGSGEWDIDYLVVVDANHHIA